MDQSNQPVQPAVAQPVAPQMVTEDPGKTLAIVGIILAFFVTIAGLVVSIIAKKKSKAAGFDGQLATVGIVINAIMLVIGTLMFVILMAITLTAYNGVQERALESQRQSELNRQKALDEIESIENQ